MHQKIYSRDLKAQNKKALQIDWKRYVQGRYGTLGLINANLEDECLENDGTQKS